MLLRRLLQAAALSAVLLAGLTAFETVRAADSTRCADVVASHLTLLPLPAGDVRQVRIIERTNIADDFGPEIFGVDAWVRLRSCSGWLVINMTPACYVRQTYTRGDCRVKGVPAY